MGNSPSSNTKPNPPDLRRIKMSFDRYHLANLTKYLYINNAVCLEVLEVIKKKLDNIDKCDNEYTKLMWEIVRICDEPTINNLFNLSKCNNYEVTTHAVYLLSLICAELPEELDRQIKNLEDNEKNVGANELREIESFINLHKDMLDKLEWLLNNADYTNAKYVRQALIKNENFIYFFVKCSQLKLLSERAIKLLIEITDNKFA